MLPLTLFQLEHNSKRNHFLEKKTSRFTTAPDFTSVGVVSKGDVARQGGENQLPAAGLLTQALGHPGSSSQAQGPSRMSQHGWQPVPGAPGPPSQAECHPEPPQGEVRARCPEGREELPGQAKPPWAVTGLIRAAPAPFISCGGAGWGLDILWGAG